MKSVKCFAALDQSGKLTPFEYTLAELEPGFVDIKVEYCGICHSDYSLITQEWGPVEYPRVPGHEIVGRVVACGIGVKGLKEGDQVGLGWTSVSCQHCDYCISGRHNLCLSGNSLIRDSFGGFAEYVRAQAQWLVKIPAGLDPAKAGPLFCGGITVFTPLLSSNLKPTDSVGVIGIGGLGHLALQFADKWGCEVIAFSSSDSKKQELLNMGADYVANSRDAEQIKNYADSLDLIITTVNATLNWKAYLNCLKPQGKLVIVGAVPEEIPFHAFDLIAGQKVIAGSNIGNPADVRAMLNFCARHKIEPQTEEFSMSDCNEAMQKMIANEVRYRVVLKSDF